MKSYNIDSNGFYGEFGGRYIPNEMQACVEELADIYQPIINSPQFQQEFHTLLRDYVGRPSPLYLARNLSQRYGCKIYLKREDLNHTGAHKINNALGQILIAQKMGKKRIIAETGAGQHGVAVATVCALMGMKCEIFMGATDIERQEINVKKMRMLGATVRAVTEGNQTLTEACDAAIREWCEHPHDTYYLIGSAVGPHPYPDIVARLQSIISAEIKEQLAAHEGRDYPDKLVACVGGGSNAVGTIYHYIDDERVEIILAEAAGKGIGSGQTAASLSVGKQGIIHGFKTLTLQDEQGNPMEAYSISAGLDYPGIGPLLAHISSQGRSQVVAITDTEAIEGGFRLTLQEGIIPAIESAHALAALEHLTFRPDEVVVVTISGRGDKDMSTYLQFM